MAVVYIFLDNGYELFYNLAGSKIVGIVVL